MQVTVALSSVTANGPLSVTLPVFLITVAVADRLINGVVGRRVSRLDHDSALVGTAVTVAVASFEVTVPLVAVALLITEPASRSVCVIV